MSAINSRNKTNLYLKPQTEVGAFLDSHKLPGLMDVSLSLNQNVMTIQRIPNVFEDHINQGVSLEISFQCLLDGTQQSIWSMLVRPTDLAVSSSVPALTTLLKFELLFGTFGDLNNILVIGENARLINANITAPLPGVVSLTGTLKGANPSFIYKGASGHITF